MKCVIEFLETVFRVRPITDPGKALFHRQIKDEREIGTEVANRCVFDAPDELGIHATPRTLICVSRIGEAVADDP